MDTKQIYRDLFITVEAGERMNNNQGENLLPHALLTTLTKLAEKDAVLSRMLDARNDTVYYNYSIEQILVKYIKYASPRINELNAVISRLTLTKPCNNIVITTGIESSNI